jgi:ribonuclease D
VKNLGGRFGVNHIADIISGSANKKIMDYRHNLNPAYNTGKPYTKAQWINFIKELVQLGYLSVVGDKYPVVALNEKSMEVIDDATVIALTRPAAIEQAVLPAADSRYDDRLFQLLRAVRKQIADANGWPPYVVFHDTTLKEMARSKPCGLAELAGIPGVGKKKLDNYGAEFVNVIKEYVDPQGNAGTHEKTVKNEMTKSEPEHPVTFQNYSLKGDNFSPQKSIEDYTRDSRRESRVKLIEDANQLQKQIQQLNADLEKAKKSLGEVLKKIESDNMAEKESIKLVKAEGRTE